MKIYNSGQVKEMVKGVCVVFINCVSIVYKEGGKKPTVINFWDSGNINFNLHLYNTGLVKIWRKNEDI